MSPLTNVSATSYLSSLTSLQNATSTAAQTNAAESLPPMRPHRGEGGMMRQAVMQAFQSLGLNFPAPQTPATTGASSSTTTPATGTTSTTTSGSGSAATATTDSQTSSLRDDMRQLMHTLFEAMKSAGNTTATSSTTSGSSTVQAAGGAGARFSSDLSALINQVSSGNVPSDLQTAFSKVVSDLQQASGTSSGTSSASGTSQATLQEFLTKLQQSLGYSAANTASSAVGNLVSTSV